MGIIRRFLAFEKYNASFRKDDSHFTKRELEHRRVVRISVAAMLCALSFVVMLLGTLAGVLDLSALAVTSAVIVFCILEMGGAYPYLVWLVTSACAFLLLPDKLVACEYFLFAGIYPVVKHRTAPLHPAAAYLIRFAFFNAVVTACAGLSVYVFALPEDVGFTFGIPLYLAGNVFFILYDFALISVTTYYLTKLRRSLHCDRL